MAASAATISVSPTCIAQSIYVQAVGSCRPYRVYVNGALVSAIATTSTTAAQFAVPANVGAVSSVSVQLAPYAIAYRTVGTPTDTTIVAACSGATVTLL